MFDKARIQSKIEELQALLDQEDNAYNYEKTFDEKWKEIGLEFFQQSLGELPKDRNKKNDTD